MHCIKNWKLQAFKNYESDCQNPNTLNNHSISSFQTCCQAMNGFFLLLRQMGRWKIPKHVLLMAMFSISWKANVSKSQYGHLDLYLKSLPDTQRQPSVFAPALEKPETWECSDVKGENRFQEIKMGPQHAYYKLALLKQIIFFPL